MGKTRRLGFEVGYLHSQGLGRSKVERSIYDKVTYIGLFLAVLCLLSVITFHFPQYLSNPMMRASYDVDQLRMLLFVCLYISFACGVLGLLLGPMKKLAFTSIMLICLAGVLGGGDGCCSGVFESEILFER